MKFSEYLNFCNNDFKTNVFNILQKYGTLNEMVSHIDNMPSFCVGMKSKLEIAINEHFFVEYGTETFRLVPTSKILYCYHSVEYIGSYHAIGLISDTGVEEFFVKGKKQHAEVFAFLTKYICGFDTQMPDCSEFTIFPDGFSGPFDWRITVSSSELAEWRMSKKLFKRNAPLEKKFKLKINPISDIIWCTQVQDITAENTDSFGLELYLLDGSKHRILAFSNKNHTGTRKLIFELALHIKKNVPHLLYGPSEEYKKLFKENPMRLLEYAKEKAK